MTTHNKTRTPIYYVWLHIKQRCYNPKNERYKDYGGRGITICEEWLNSFEAFYRDMGDVPEGLTLGRKDNDGHYCKENCEWQTYEQQAQNKRNNHYLTLNGKTHTIMKWTRITGLSEVVIRMRLKRGWSVEETLTTPIRIRR